MGQKYWPSIFGGGEYFWRGGVFLGGGRLGLVKNGEGEQKYWTSIFWTQWTWTCEKFEGEQKYWTSIFGE